MRRQSDAVAPAAASAPAKIKKAARLTADSLPVQSFPTLLQHLATRCRNTCRIGPAPDGPTFEQLTQATPLQARALQLIGL